MIPPDAEEEKAMIRDMRDFYEKSDEMKKH
jgi:hypothetical protein